MCSRSVVDRALGACERPAEAGAWVLPALGEWASAPRRTTEGGLTPPGRRAPVALGFPVHGRNGASAYSGVGDVSLRMGLRALIFPIPGIDFIIKWAFL